MPVKDQVGFSAMIPGKVSVRFRTRCCSGTTPPPDVWTVEVDAPDAASLPSLGGSPAETVIDESAVAIFNGGSTPVNSSTLTDLATAIAADLCLWRENQGDHVFAGIVAPEMNAQNDEVEWQIDDEGCRTTFSSGPFVQEADRLMHHDPTGWCEVPCDAIELYGADMAIVGQNVRIPTYSAWLDDDYSPPRIKTKRKSQTDFKACCDQPTPLGCVCPSGAPLAWNWSWTTYEEAPFAGLLPGPPNLAGTTTGKWEYFNSFNYKYSNPQSPVPLYASTGPGWSTTLTRYGFDPFNNNQIRIYGDCQQFDTGLDVYTECYTQLWLCSSVTFYDLFGSSSGPIAFMATRDYQQVSQYTSQSNPNYNDKVPNLTAAMSVSNLFANSVLFDGYSQTLFTCSPFVLQAKKNVGFTQTPFTNYYNTYNHTS